MNSPRVLTEGRRGFSLVEVAIALGIVAFCVIAILSLFSTGLRVAKESEDEIRAANLASSFVCRLRAAPGANLTALGFPFGALTNGGGQLFQIPDTAPVFLNGDGTKAANAATAMKSGGYALSGSGLYDVTNHVASLNFTLWWPAATTLTNASGKYRVSTFIDTATP